MTQLVLHHFKMSPFSEKVRLILGAKGLAWHSVEVPMVLPKPDVVALTGGYRRTPFLQIGADIYCDSAWMCKVIDRLAPQVPLYPPARQGLAEMVAQWADSALFWTAVPFTSQPENRAELFPGMADDAITALYEDRARMTPNLRRPSAADAAAQLRSYLARLQDMLGDGRPFLLGAAPCIADFSVAHPLWFMRRASRSAALLLRYPVVCTWLAQVEAFGHGAPIAMRSSEAIAVAAACATLAPCSIAPDQGFAGGDNVVVTAVDYAQDSVTGRLAGLTDEEVVLLRTDKRAGTVQVHFPRFGYRVEATG